MEEVYDNPIDEFVDWTDGKEAFYDPDANEWRKSESSITGGLPVKGGRIRELLQKMSQFPVYLQENKEKGKYQLFSSKRAAALYEAGQHDELLLGEFDGPSAYKIEAMLEGSSLRYYTGAESSANVAFTWKCVNSSVGGEERTTSSVNIKIYNDGVKIWEITDRKDASDVVQDSNSYRYELDILSHLVEGSNAIEITIASEDFGAKKVLSNIQYILVKFSLQETLFDNFTTISDNNIQIQPFYNISAKDAVCYLHVLVDDIQIYNNTIDNNSIKTLPLPAEIIQSVQNGEYCHVLTMYMSTTLDGTDFHSNVICKQFVFTIEDPTIQQSFLAATFNFNKNSDADITNYINKRYKLYVEQYSKMSIEWGLMNYDATIAYSSVKFYISDSPDSLVNAELIKEIPDVAVNSESPVPLEYIPSEFYDTKYLGYTIGSGTTFNKIADIEVSRFSYYQDIVENTNYVFKYNAFNKNNNSDRSWTPVAGTVGTSVEGVTSTSNDIQWTETNGWYQNSFRTQGLGKYLDLNLVNSSSTPLITTVEVQSQFTFEIDFMTEYAASDNDLLVDICGFIKIYPNRAEILNDSGSVIVKTNFKTGERINMSFIKYPTMVGSSYSNLFLIVSNGILERGASGGGGETHRVDSPTIRIGGSNSGIRVFSMRYYKNTIPWSSCYNNWIYDSDNKAELVLRNRVYFGTADNPGEIDESKCLGIMDTILVEGDLSTMIGADYGKVGKKINAIKRICPYDSTKDFTIYNCWIRKHGQSNLAYPVPSFKIWSNKEIEEGSTIIKPTIETVVNQIYTKNRMQVYNDAVPANKWVLQSNFADSSCAHNGSFLRKWQELCYSAKFYTGESTYEYKLRTPPQLFTTNQRVTPLDGTGVENRIAQGLNKDGLQWGDYMQGHGFPWPLRQAANSFPCLLFYRAEEGMQWTFLGQYVFMDDKKSDFEYGERSIYCGWEGDDGQDPFVMKKINTPYDPEKYPDDNPAEYRPQGSTKYDKGSTYKVWDNKDVVRIEVLSVDDPYVNFMRHPAVSGAQHDYWKIYDPEHRNMCVANDWFELIYPDIDDLTDAQIDTKYKVWTDFCDWVISTNDQNLTPEARQAKFEAEAAQHLDLYRIAAYYIWYTMFGLVDSVNRNAQWKTYDGKHWSIEPWDMDVALGRQNDGSIVYDPPMDRQTPAAGGLYAFSGHASVLWNHLEAWTYWMDTIVPTTAQALYDAGLTYNNIKEELDNYFSLKWPEYIYDKSGEYKYIYSGQPSENLPPSFLTWLQGASINQRHWWLSTSMDYWFSKFGRGSFPRDTIKIGTSLVNGRLANMYIKPMQKAFFGWYAQEGGYPAKRNIVQGYNQDGSLKNSVTLTVNGPGDTPIGLNTKVPFYVCGASSIEEFDMREIGCNLEQLMFQVPLNLNSLLIGATIANSADADGYKELSYFSIPKTALKFSDQTKNVSNLQKLDLTGQYLIGEVIIPNTITHFYGAGSGFLKGFSATGNAFEVLHLPHYHEAYDSAQLDEHDNPVVVETYDLAKLELIDCSWNELKFFNSKHDVNYTQVPYEVITPEGDIEIDYYTEYHGYVKEIPLTDVNTQLRIHKIIFKGNTCNGAINPENGNHTRDLVFKWINGDYAQGLASADKLLALQLEKVWWEHVTVAQLRQLAPFYNKTVPNIKGRITLDVNETVDATILAEIQSLFGDGVFSPGSSGLVVDYPNQISIISVGSPASYDIESNKYIINESDEVLRGNEYSVVSKLSFVKFNLDSGSQQADWYFYSRTQDGHWLNTNGVDGHTNVSIFSQTNEDTQITSYYLKITESSINIQDYEFGILALNPGETQPRLDPQDMIVIHVAPVTHGFELGFDSDSQHSFNTDLDTLTTPPTVLFRQNHNPDPQASDIEKCIAVITTSLSGNAVAPVITWELTGAGIYGTLDMVISDDGRTATLSPKPDMVSSIAKEGTLACTARYIGGSIRRTYGIKMQSDLIVLVRNGNMVPMYDYFATLLSIPSGKYIYESDLKRVTSAAFENITSFDTAIQGVRIFDKIPNCVSLNIAKTVGDSGVVIPLQASDVTRSKLPLLTSLTLNNVGNDLTLDFRGTTSPSINITTINSEAGVMASGLVNLNLSRPEILHIGELGVPMAGSLAVSDISNIYELSIINDSNVSYVNNSSKWLGLIGTQIHYLTIKNTSSISSISNDHHELVNLAVVYTYQSANTAFDGVGNITVTGGFNVAWKDIPQEVYDAIQGILGKYYVLYNPNYLVHASNTLHNVVTTWYNASGDTRTEYGNPDIGWTNEDLLGIANATNTLTSVDFSNSGLTSVEVSVIKSKGAVAEIQNILNNYLTGYNNINLQGTSVDPKLVASSAYSAIVVRLGNPTSVTIDGSGRTGGANVSVQDSTGIRTVDLHKVYRGFSLVFGWGVNNISGTINCEEVASTSTRDILADGLTAIAANRISFFTLLGKVASGIEDTDNDKIYIASNYITALQTAYPSPGFTLNVRSKMEAVDDYLQEALDYLDIKSPSQLNAYSWASFWRAVYAEMKDRGMSDSAFTTLANHVKWAPESQYMTAACPTDNPSGAYNVRDEFNLWIKGYGTINNAIPQPDFTELRLLCVGRSTSFPNSSPKAEDAIPSGKYTRIFKQYNSYTSTSIDGIIIFCEDNRVQKYNTEISSNYAIINLKAYFCDNVVGPASHTYSAFQTNDGNSIITTPGASNYVVKNGGAYKVIPSCAITTNLGWPMAVWRMMSTDTANKKLEDWFRGTFNPQNESELPTGQRNIKPA